MTPEDFCYVVDRVLDLVEVLVDAIESTPDCRVVVGVLPASSFDKRGGDACHDDGERSDQGDDYFGTHAATFGVLSPRT